LKTAFSARYRSLARSIEGFGQLVDRKRKLGEFGFAGDDNVVPFEVGSLDVRGRMGHCSIRFSPGTIIPSRSPGSWRRRRWLRSCSAPR
jgi:hypothetical protein